MVYFTLSSNFQENEGVVRNCLEEFNEKCDNPAHRYVDCIAVDLGPGRTVPLIYTASCCCSRAPIHRDARGKFILPVNRGSMVNRGPTVLKLDF